MCPPLETFSLQHLMSFNVKLLLYIVSERGCRLNLSLFSPLQHIICCKLSWISVCSVSAATQQKVTEYWVCSAPLLHMGGKLSWVGGSKEWSRVVGGSACVTATAACSGSRLGSVRMAVVVLRRRSELRTTDKKGGKNVLQYMSFKKVQHGFGSVLVWLTGSESRQGAVLIQPRHSGSTQVCCTGRGHHAIIGLEQRLDDDAELALGWGNTFCWPVFQKSKVAYLPITESSQKRKKVGQLVGCWWVF